MFIDMKPYWFTQEGIDKIEKDYNAKYMGYWCTKHSSGWWNSDPVDVFYQPNPDFEKGHSHYFGMFTRNGKVYITNAESAFKDPIVGILSDEGEVLVSRYRHDHIARGGVMVDGGRDYMKRSVKGEVINVIIDKDQFSFSRKEWDR